VLNRTVKNNYVDVPKVFWRYFDLYRRKRITLEEYSEKSGITIAELRAYLLIVSHID
jgi:hypothetical protein